MFGDRWAFGYVWIEDSRVLVATIRHLQCGDGTCLQDLLQKQDFAAWIRPGVKCFANNVAAVIKITLVAFDPK